MAALPTSVPGLGVSPSGLTLEILSSQSSASKSLTPRRRHEKPRSTVSVSEAREASLPTAIGGGGGAAVWGRALNGRGL